MIRKLSFVCVIGWLLCASSSVFADNETIFEALKALNSSSAQFQDPATARATAKQFFKLVRTESGSADVLGVLKELKSNNEARWKEVQNAENELMAVVQQTLDATCRESIRGRAGRGALGTLHSYGYSGKWPLKPKSQLTFDGDFDVSFFAATLAETDPENPKGILHDVVNALTEALGAGPESLGIVVTGYGYEGEANVYVSSAGKKWAIQSSMSKLYLVHPETGKITEITGSPEKFFIMMQLMLLSELHPELFESGFRLKKGVTMEQVRQVLLEDPRLEGTYRIFFEGTRYSTGQAAAGAIDMACHVAEVIEATSSLEKRTKVAKQVARSTNIFINAMGGTEGQWRKEFLPSDIEFMRECATLDRAKITNAEAENARVQFLLFHRDAGETTAIDQQEYARLKAAADAAKADLDSAEQRVMAAAGGEAQFSDRAVEIMRKQAQVAHRDFILEIMSLSPAERARALAAYEADLKALLEHYKNKEGVPAEAMEWAQKALDATQKLSEICQNNAQAMEGIGGKLKRIYEIFNNPDKIRENVERVQNVKRVLGETEMGKALLEKVPDWAFANERPPAITDIAFESPVNFIAEAVVAPVNSTVNALMMVDMVLQLSDVWSSNQTDTQKVMSTAGIVSMLLVNHLYLVPALYHASLTGDPKQITYAVACFICPPAMLPMLVDSFGTRIVSGAKRSLFQRELKEMLQASTFNPARGQEPKEWANNRDLVHYQWMTLETENDSYARKGERTLVTYIRVLASDTREEIPLSAKNMTGLGVLVLPGGVAKSFRAMIQDGDHQLFRENEALASALAALQKFNCDQLVTFMDSAPKYCFGAWAEQKSGIRLDLINNDFAEGEVARLQAEGKPGESMVQIVRTVLDQRAKLQSAVIDELAGAIIVSFEEEMRARKLVELGLLDDALKELITLGEELAIKDELKDAVTEALRLAGVMLGGDALSQSTSGSDAKKREEIAKVTDNWLKTYRSVAETRRMLVGLVGGYGTPKTDLDRFLRGKPPLQVVPAKDSEAAQTSRQVLMGTPRDASSIIYKFKGDKLDPDPRDSASEATLLRYLFTARVMELTVDLPLAMISLWLDGPGENESPSDFGDRAQAGLKRELDMKNKSFWGGAPDFSAYLDRYQILARGYAEKFAGIRDQYKTTPVQLTVQGLTQVETGKQVILKVVPTRNGKPADDALKSARVEWAVKGAVNNTGLVWQFTPDKEEVLNITVNAVLEIGGKMAVIGTSTHQLAVKKPEEKKTPDKTEKSTEDTKDAKKDGKEKIAPVITGPMTFSGTVFGNWEGGNTKDGFALTRKPAKIKGPCGSDAAVTATLSAEFNAWSSKPYAKNKDEAFAQAELDFKARRPGDTPNDMAVGLFMAGGIEGVSGFSMGEYSGAIADFAIWVRRGSSSDMGSHGSYLGANGRGAAVKEGVGLIRFKYNVNGGGCYDNSDRAYLVTQAAVAQQEAKAILASLRMDGKGDIKQEAYKGPKYDGSDLPRVVLVPAQLAKLNIGDAVKVQAVVENARPEDSPFSYNWGGTFDGKPEELTKSDTARIKPEKPGKYTLSVSVDGARFGLGSASLPYEVKDIKVKIEKVPPDAKPVPVGVRTTFKATVTSDGAPAAGNFVFRWQPHPEVTFDKLDASTPDVGATFTKPGSVKVWVTLLEKRGAALATLAESDQLDIEVIKPTLELAFEPKDPFVSQEIRAKLAVKPDLKEIDFRWMPVPENARQLSESQDNREITFYAKDDKPIELRVLARVPMSGEDLGEAKGSIKAKQYALTVTGPKAMGPKPRIWKEGVGLVEVDSAIAVNQIVEFSADVQPAPATGPLRYQWTITSGACSVNNPTSRDARLTASQAGGCQAAVSIKDKNDVELGKGSGSFAATITQEQIKQGEQKAKEQSDKTQKAQQAKQKLQGARDNASKGYLDQAISEAEEAAKLDPANTEAANYTAQLKSEKEQVLRQLDKTEKLIAESNFAEAQKELIVAQNLHGKYAPVAAMDSRLANEWQKYNAFIRDEFYKVRSANEKKDFKAALELAQQIRSTRKIDRANDEQLRQMEEWARNQEREKEKLRQLLNSAMELYRNYDYAGALKKFDEGFINLDNFWAFDSPERSEYVRLRGDAFTKNRRLGELMTALNYAATTQPTPPKDVMERALLSADEAQALQPTNTAIAKLKQAISARLGAESKIASAQQILKEASQLLSQDRISEAIAKFREYLTYVPSDETVANQVKALEAGLKAAAPLSVSVSPAQQVINSGEKLTTAARVAGGVPPYSYEWFSGDNRSQVKSSSIEWILRGAGPRNLRVIVTDAAGTKAEARCTVTVQEATEDVTGNPPDGASAFYHVDLRPYGGKKEAPRKIKDIEIEDSSWIRLKSTDEKKLQLRIPLPAPVTARSIAVVSNLDDATYLEQGGIIARLSVLTTTGTQRFDINAGIHSAEWNRSAGPKHKVDTDTYVGSDRYLAIFTLPGPATVRELTFDYVDTNVQRWDGHAPGFCLRGVTLLTSKDQTGTITGQTTLPSPVEISATDERRLFYNGNIGGVQNNPPSATTFRADQPWLITYIMTYHYNMGRGTPPGTIALRHQDGTVYGPWQAATNKPSPYLYWECRPNVVIKAGTYTVIDSDPATWSWNNQSGGGMTEIKGNQR